MDRQHSLDALMAHLCAPFTDNHDKGKLDVQANGVTALKWIKDKYLDVLFMDGLHADAKTGELTGTGIETYVNKRDMFPTRSAITLVAIHIFLEYRGVYQKAKRCFHYTYSRILLWDEQCLKYSDETNNQVIDLEVGRYRSWNPASLDMDNDGSPVESSAGHGEHLALEDGTQG